ncbi:MAG: hypothetical protein DME14_00905 [Candidatus Rokuibacteriota bacterium]|nr:MAG: hypothetical protein DME14_00905 [Candidatus Rokubacteria bacterium]
MTGTEVAAVGVVTGWGEGAAALPSDAVRAAAGRRVIAAARPPLVGERFRRATRECLLGVAAVEALLREANIEREEIRGCETALVYVTAAGYGAANHGFIVAGAARRDVGAGAANTEYSVGGPRKARAGAVASSTLHFPYTAPSAVPAEVAIEFGLTGPYVILLGGAAATIDGLWQATLQVGRGRCRRALVLAVETFSECEELWARGRWLLRPPLVESAACALLIPGPSRATYAPASTESPLEALARARAGETLACAPLIALALARAGGGAAPFRLTGQWRGRRAGLAWEAH